MPRYNVEIENGQKVFKDYSKPPVLNATEVSYGSGTVEDALDALTEVSKENIATNATLYRYGKLRILLFSGYDFSASTKDNVIIPSADRPDTYIRNNVNTSAQGNCECYVAADGKIGLANETLGQTVYGAIYGQVAWILV